MYHTRQTKKKYVRLHRTSEKHADCDFCEPYTYVSEIIEEQPKAYVARNRVSYNFWERRKVIDHLMVIPKKHVGHLSELSATDRHAVMDVIARYEAQGYDVFMRSPHNPTRSVSHQHTHLIKTAPKLHRFVLFIAKPYLLIYK